MQRLGIKKKYRPHFLRENKPINPGQLASLNLKPGMVAMRIGNGDCMTCTHSRLI